MSQPIPRLSVTSGSIARAVLLVAGWMVVMTVLARARGSLVLFVLGLMTAAIFYPVVGWLGRRMPTWIAIVLVSLLAAAATGVVGVRIYDEVNRQARDLAQAVDEAVTNLEESPRYGGTVERLDLRERADEFTSAILDDVSINGSRLTELAPSLASGAGDAFIIWLFAVMMLAAGPPFVHAFVRLFPSPVTQARVRMVIAIAHRRTTRYIGLMLVRAGVLFGLTFTAAALLDLRVPTVLGLTVAFLSLFPCVGLLVGGVLFALAGALRWPELVGPIIVLSIVLQAVDVVFVQRRIEARSVAVRSFLLVVAALIGWEVEGIRGILIAAVGVIFAVAAAEEGMAIRDGDQVDPGLAVAPVLAPPSAPPGAQPLPSLP